MFYSLDIQDNYDGQMELQGGVIQIIFAHLILTIGHIFYQGEYTIFRKVLFPLGPRRAATLDTRRETVTPNIKLTALEKFR